MAAIMAAAKARAHEKKLVNGEGFVKYIILVRRSRSWRGPLCNRRRRRRAQRFATPIAGDNTRVAE